MSFVLVRSRQQVRVDQSAWHLLGLHRARQSGRGCPHGTFRKGGGRKPIDRMRTLISFSCLGRLVRSWLTECPSTPGNASAPRYLKVTFAWLTDKCCSVPCKLAHYHYDWHRLGYVYKENLVRLERVAPERDPVDCADASVISAFDLFTGRIGPSPCEPCTRLIRCGFGCGVRVTKGQIHLPHRLL